MIDVGNRRGCRITDRFRVVEAVMPRIRASNKKPIDAMVGAVNKAPFSQLIVARIFMKQTGEDRRGHIGTDAVVRKGRAVTFPVGVPSSSPPFWFILFFSYSTSITVQVTP